MDTNKKEILIIAIITSFLLGLTLGLLFNIEPSKANHVRSSYESGEIGQHLHVNTHIRSVVLKHEMIQNEIEYWHLENPSKKRVRKKATFIYGYAKKYNIDPFLLTALGIVESNLTQNRVSHRGAVGISQIMPRIAQYLEVNPYDMEENIKGGAKFLNELENQYNSTELALAHYNAGVNPERKLGWSSVASYVWNIQNITDELQRRYINGLGK